MPPVTITVSGATGLIGSELVRRLQTQGHRVRRLVRTARQLEVDDVAWEPAAGVLDPRSLEGTDIIVNLAGAPIAVRWTATRKTAIRNSRLQSTALLARVAATLTPPPTMLSGSAVGYYGDRGDERLDERSASGDDFLAKVTRDWEAAAAPVAQAGGRLATLRTGIVLSRRGGALAKLLPPFRLGLGGPIGHGQQWMSWISLDDHVRAMEHVILDAAVVGPVNLTAPNPVTNAEFAATLGRALARPAMLRVPAFALELAFGEMARATLLTGQRVVPNALQLANFTFNHPTLESALQWALND